eukprot:9387445-Heterocapsa_arctica.AAC.1
MAKRKVKLKEKEETKIEMKWPMFPEERLKVLRSLWCSRKASEDEEEHEDHEEGNIYIYIC